MTCYATFGSSSAINYYRSSLTYIATPRYNRYSLDQLSAAYPSIGFKEYTSGLGAAGTSDESFVVVEPAYFGLLDAIIQGDQWPQSTIVNFVAIRMLFVSAYLSYFLIQLLLLSMSS